MRRFDLCCIGSGVGSSEIFFQLSKLFINNNDNLKKKNYKIILVDQFKENIGGGIPYTKEFCQYGYFNNPCRLSPNKFVDWVIKKKNIIKIFDYLETEGGISGRQWIKKNFFLKKKIKKKNLSEIYLPRAALGFWMKEKYIETLKLLKKLKDEKKINIQLFFAENKAVKIKKNNEKFVICLAKNSNINRINFAKNALNFKDSLNKNLNEISSKKIVISTGVQKAKKITNLKNTKYIEDLYLRRGSKKIIELINDNNKKNLVIHILGSKAGFLESLTEISFIHKLLKKKIKIISSSIYATTLNPAKLNNGKVKLQFLNTANINKISKAKEIFELIKKELTTSNDKKVNYSLWTKILEKKLLNKALNKLNKDQLNIYNLYFFQKIRSLTRFTYPETINAMIKLKSLKILNLRKEKVTKIFFINNNFYTHCIDNYKRVHIIKSDIVINVMGPTKFKDLMKKNNLLNSIIKIGAKYNEVGFKINNSFEVNNAKNLFVINSLASGFNKNRETILNATINNAKKCSQKIFSNI